MLRFRWAAGLCAVLAFRCGASAATVSWLDQKPVVQWNTGATLPHAQAIDPDSLKACGAQLRRPATTEDRAVTQAGWRLFASYRAFNETSVVTALSGFDGMCRPNGYQVFVFVNTVFAGTLSPVVMNSRTDGALDHVELYGPGRISADFLRYKADDALCCSSSTSSAQFTIAKKVDGERVVVQDVTTSKTPH